MTEKKHSSLGASSAHRWFACPGSPRMCLEAPPQKQSEYAAEGTHAHTIAESVLKRNGNWDDITDASPEELDHVQLYVDTVLRDKADLKGKLEVEKKLDLSSIVPDGFGTNDALVYSRWEKLIVYDFKYGAGVPVEVEDNVQLLYYALGAYLELADLEFTEIEMVIVQPRCEHREGPVRRWTVPVEYLQEFAERLRKAAAATQASNAPLIAGPQCRWCPAFAICPAAADRTTQVAIADFTEPVVQKSLKTPETLTMAQIKTVLDNAGYLDAWLRAVEQYAEDTAKNGGTVPGYKLVKKRSNRKWLSETEAEKALKPKFGVRIYSDPKILSPTQMEKMIGKKDGETTIIETLSECPDTGCCLVSESDPRPVVASPALTDFA